MRKLLAVTVLLSLSLFAIVHADPGVGVNVGSIDVEDELTPGGGYDLPGVGVINTGDDALDYTLSVGYDEGQSALRPPEDWFGFQPSRFTLEPGAARAVSVRLTLPASARPGHYFAYLEAHPVAAANGVSVSVAAATKLSFSVKQTSWLDAQRTRLNRWLDEHQTLIFVVTGTVLLGLALWTWRRLPFEIAVRRKGG